MPDPVRFRPHHFLCALGFEGKGYSSRFTANMTEIVEGRLRGPGGDATPIEVTSATDDICAPCPKRIGTLCTAQSKIANLDAAHADALGVAPGDTLTWGEAQSRIKARITPDTLDTICADCSWLKHGMCTSAVARLIAET
ncbi:MAG: DUF1284 domain-containing protein [Pseudomonadota bacterium]